jgi:hypothetical protein
MSKTGRIGFRIDETKKKQVIKLAKKRKLDISKFTEALYDIELLKEKS